MKKTLCVLLVCCLAVLPGCQTLGNMEDISVEQAIAILTVIVAHAPQMAEAVGTLIDRLKGDEKPKDRIETLNRVLDLYERVKDMGLIPTKTDKEVQPALLRLSST